MGAGDTGIKTGLLSYDGYGLPDMIPAGQTGTMPATWKPDLCNGFPLQAGALSGDGYGYRRPILNFIEENQGTVAETEGFEPSVPLNGVRRFSKPLVSATHPRLRRCRALGYSGGGGGDQPVAFRAQP